MPRQEETLGKDDKLVGAHVSAQVSDHLSLLALYSRTSKSDILKEQILIRLQEEEKIATMISVIAQRALNEWIATGRNMPFGRFKKQTQDFLDKRKISHEHSKEILKEMRKLHEANEKRPVK